MEPRKARNFIVSYPKSGRTWIRFMLNTYLMALHESQEKTIFDFEKSQLYKKEISLKWTHLSGAMKKKLPYYNLIIPEVVSVGGRDPLLLVRNCYPTLASAYYQAHYRIKVSHSLPSAFVRSPKYGALKIASFYNMIQKELNLSDERIFSYEEFRLAPEENLERLLFHLNIPLHKQLLISSIQASTPENMRLVAAQPEYAGTQLAPLDPDDPRTAKVRTPNQSDFRSLFSQEDIDYITTVFGCVYRQGSFDKINRCFLEPGE